MGFLGKPQANCYVFVTAAATIIPEYLKTLGGGGELSVVTWMELRKNIAQG